MVKKLTGKNIGGMIFLLVILFIGLALGSYSYTKSVSLDGMKGTNKLHNQFSDINVPKQQSNTQVNTNCIQRDSINNPAELLPAPSNNQFSNLQTNNSLQNVNLLKAGHHIGIDTVGQSLRNANLQLRSEPANPRINVCPWNQSTIEPDLVRRPLEIGCGPKVCAN